MKLTGKCLDAFGDQCKYNYEDFMELPEPCQNALIIEFLDTKQYKGKPLFEFCFSFYWGNKIPLQSFNDICIQSIEKANEIFNLNNK